MASKSHQWFKSYSHYTEEVDFAYWWSFYGEGLRSTGLPRLVLTIFRLYSNDSQIDPGLSNTAGRKSLLPLWEVGKSPKVAMQKVLNWNPISWEALHRASGKYGKLENYPWWKYTELEKLWFVIWIYLCLDKRWQWDTLQWCKKNRLRSAEMEKVWECKQCLCKFFHTSSKICAKFYAVLSQKLVISPFRAFRVILMGFKMVKCHFLL